MGDDFNPRSTDAMFAEILANMKRDHDERAAFRADMKETLRLHGERIGALESFRTSLKAKVATVSAGVGLATTAAIEFAKVKFGGGDHH